MNVANSSAYSDRPYTNKLKAKQKIKQLRSLEKLKLVIQMLLGCYCLLASGDAQTPISAHQAMRRLLSRLITRPTHMRRLNRLNRPRRTNPTPTPSHTTLFHTTPHPYTVPWPRLQQTMRRTGVPTSMQLR